MPIYSHVCESCGNESTRFLKMAERDLPYTCQCGGTLKRAISTPHITPDIEPYQTVAADKETGKLVNIRSRKDHREFLKRNGYEELGTQDYWGHQERERERRN